MVDTENEFTGYVISRLGRTANRDDLIMEVCHKKGLDWDDAEVWINQVADEHGRAVAFRQAPAFIALCGIAGFSGLALVGTALYAVIQPYLAYQNGINQYAALVDYTAILWQVIPQLIAGVALMVGAGVGIGKILSRLRYNEPLDT